MRHNLATTQKILRSRMREAVLGSTQMKADNKLLYLISLKCSSLRMMNRGLAWRQELPIKFKNPPK